MVINKKYQLSILHNGYASRAKNCIHHKSSYQLFHNKNRPYTTNIGTVYNEYKLLLGGGSVFFSAHSKNLVLDVCFLFWWRLFLFSLFSQILIFFSLQQMVGESVDSSSLVSCLCYKVESDRGVVDLSISNITNSYSHWGRFSFCLIGNR